MMSSNLGLILDGVILVFLAVTIFYASRLTIFLKNFRQSRETVEALIRNLSTAIDKAEYAIKNMHALSDESRTNLQDVINEASFLSDELRFMNESGDSLAERLEKLADRNRELVDLMEDQGGIGRPKIKVEEDGFNHLDEDVWGLQIEKEEVPKVPLIKKARQKFKAKSRAALEPAYELEQEEPQPKIQQKNQEKPSSALGFMINDREFDDEEELHEEDDGAWSTLLESEAKETANTNFTSQAERDLYEALQRSPSRESAKKNSTNRLTQNRIRESV